MKKQTDGRRKNVFHKHSLKGTRRTEGEKRGPSLACAMHQKGDTYRLRKDKVAMKKVGIPGDVRNNDRGCGNEV